MTYDLTCDIVSNIYLSHATITVRRSTYELGQRRSTEEVRRRVGNLRGDVQVPYLCVIW